MSLVEPLISAATIKPASVKKILRSGAESAADS